MTEFDFIERLRARTRDNRRPSELLRGIGDDAAVIRESAGRDTLITADLLVEDIDFRRDSMPPRLLGHKALAVSLSDIAAMGGRPRWALLSLGVPEDIWNSDYVDKFYQGFFALAGRYDVQLIGGDLSRTTGKIVIDSIVSGECESGQAILRKGASVGDHLFVTGSLGGSAAGLRLIERGVPFGKSDFSDPDARPIQELLMRHFRPEPRVGWGLVLGEEGLASAMIDISDGLSSDLHHLCKESGVGAAINSALLPLDSLVVGLCGRRALDPLMLALHGGEDFELLFTVRPADVERLPSRVDGVGISCIGEIADEAGKIQIVEKDRIWNLEQKGFEHFELEHSARHHA